MAHFGITALGPQSPFLFKHRFSVAIFELEEFAVAFDSAAKGAPALPVDRVPAVLRAVYRGEPPREEGERVHAAMAAAAAPGVSISRDAFLRCMQDLQKDQTVADAARARAAHHSSFEVLAEQRHRNVRPAEAQTTLFAEPLTQSAVVGWRADEPPLGDVRYPKVHCAETKYAAALQASGIF